MLLKAQISPILRYIDMLGTYNPTSAAASGLCVYAQCLFSVASSKDKRFLNDVERR